jgi:hypothetical protein
MGTQQQKLPDPKVLFATVGPNISKWVAHQLFDTAWLLWRGQYPGSESYGASILSVLRTAGVIRDPKTSRPFPDDKTMFWELENWVDEHTIVSLKPPSMKETAKRSSPRQPQHLPTGNEWCAHIPNKSGVSTEQIKTMPWHKKGKV